MPTSEEIAQLRERLSRRTLSDSDVFQLSPLEREVLFLDRAKRSEEASLNAANATEALGKRVELIAQQIADHTGKIEDIMGKIEFILRKLSLAGGIGGIVAIALKVIDMVLR
jgi:hypothetical protein